MATAPAQGLKRHKRPHTPKASGELDLTDLVVDDGARANVSLSFLCLSRAGTLKCKRSLFWMRRVFDFQGHGGAV